MYVDVPPDSADRMTVTVSKGEIALAAIRLVANCVSEAWDGFGGYTVVRGREEGAVLNVVLFGYTPRQRFVPLLGAIGEVGAERV